MSLASAWLTVAGAAEVAEGGPRIVNGLSTHHFPTTAAYLVGNDPDSAETWCSAVIIGCDTVLTAAHCVCDRAGPQCQNLAPDGFVYLQHGGISTVTDIAVHSNYSFPNNDVAVLKVAPQITGIEPTPINEVQAIANGTTGVIAGFGRTGGSAVDYGIKRWGTVATTSCSGGISNGIHVCWQFTNPIDDPGDDSNTCNADSGGPLFVDLGTGELVAGVTSGGSSASCSATDNSYDASVFAFVDWINTNGGPDVGSSTCGSLPAAGTPDTEISGFDGRLSQSNPSDQHNFTVVADAQTLRVALNAHDDGIADFDMLVTGPGGASCAKNGSGQFGVCEFNAPDAGAWTVQVSRANGTGDYQVTATVFDGAPATELLDLNLVPRSTTVVQGRRVVYRIQSENLTPAELTVVYSVTVTDPNGTRMTMPLRPNSTIVYAANEIRDLRARQRVRRTAPLGEYLLEVIANAANGDELAHDTFMFTVVSQ